MSSNKIFSLFFLFIYINNFVYNNELCINNEPYMKSNTCVSICTESEIFIDKICYPISSNETDIKNMYEIIKSYIRSKSINGIRNEIIIKGEGIIYQITTNKLIQNESISNNSINLNLGEKCLQTINEELKVDYYIILINIINNNYTSSTQGIKIFIQNTDFDINLLCGGKTISLGIPVKIQQETLINYEQLIDRYNYDILNLNGFFYTDICKLYTSEDKTDMPLAKRIYFFGSHGINVCAENCDYNYFDINTSKIFCSCYLETGEEINEEKRNIGQQIYDKIAEFLDLINFDVMLCIKLVFSNPINNIYTNYGFMIMSIIIFLYILCVIITCCTFRQKIINIVSNFKNLKMKFRNIYKEEINKVNNKDINQDNENKIEDIKEGYNDNQKEINVPIPPNKENILNLNDKNDEEDEEEEEEEDDDEEEEEENEEDEKNKEKKENEKEKKNVKKEKSQIKIGPFEDNLKKEDEYDKKEIKIIPKEEAKKLKEEPKINNEYKDTSILSPRKIDRDNINNSDPNPPQQNYFDYNKYIQDYNNYINYMQYYNNYVNNYINNLNYFNNLNNYNNNFNNSPNYLSQEISSQNDSNKPNDEGLFQLIIPYDKIKDKVKEKNNKGQNKSNKKIKIMKDKNKDENNQYKKNKKVKKKINKGNKKNKEKGEKGEKGTMHFEINILDVLKPNPPKNKTTINIKNDESQNSAKDNLKKDINDGSKKDDNSVYNLSEIQNNKNQKNIKNLSNLEKNINKNGIVLYNQSLNNKNELISQNDNTKIKENDEKISELSSQEDEIKFGSEEFYKSLIKISQEKRIGFFIDEELNNLEYEYAVELDKRSYCELYFSFLKKQNIIIFCLSYCSNDYNLSIMKVALLLLQISLFIIISAFFFTDNTLNYLYENKNKFDVSFMIRQLGLTFIICYGINIIFKILVRSNSRIIEIKQENENLLDGIKSLKCKFIFYYIMSLMIIFFGWFYISCFCAVFHNTQIILLKCSLYTLLSTFVYPFFICLITSSIRICALSDGKKDKKCLYGFSKVFSYI